VRLLADDATWTIVGNSPVSRTYRSRQEFVDVVIDPVQRADGGAAATHCPRLYAEDDWVIALFDARPPR
jgi:hypothetical protein